MSIGCPAGACQYLLWNSSSFNVNFPRGFLSDSGRHNPHERAGPSSRELTEDAGHTEPPARSPAHHGSREVVHPGREAHEGEEGLTSGRVGEGGES